MPKFAARSAIFSVLVPTIVALSAGVAQAGAPCNWAPPPFSPEETGDTFYEPMVSNEHIAEYVRIFDLDYGDWNAGRGWEDPGNVHLPMARTLNALWALRNSEPPGSTPSDNWLAFGVEWAPRQIDEIDSRCGDGSKYAYTQFGPIIDNYVQVYDAFQFELTVPERAATLMHEARHAEGWWSAAHNCSGNRDSSWEYGGPHNVEANWLWDYADGAVNTTQALRDRARDAANGILAGDFCTDPGFRI